MKAGLPTAPATHTKQSFYARARVAAVAFAFAAVALTLATVGFAAFAFLSPFAFAPALRAVGAKRARLAAVVVDRGGYLYTGRVQAVADGAREAGLNF